MVAPAPIVQFRRSRKAVCIHDRSTDRDVIDHEAKLRTALIAQYAPTVAATRRVCHTHSNADSNSRGIPPNRLNSRPDARVATIVVAVDTTLEATRCLWMM